MKFRVSIVGAAGTMANKCPKCTVDAVVLVVADFHAIAKLAINKLRLKIKDERRIRLALKTQVREHPAGTELPTVGDLSDYLANDCVIAVSVRDAPLTPPATPVG